MIGGTVWIIVGIIGTIVFLGLVVLAVRHGVLDQKAATNYYHANAKSFGPSTTPAPPPQGTAPILAGLAVLVLGGLFFVVTRIDRTPSQTMFYTPTCGSPTLLVPKQAFSDEAVRVQVTNVSTACPASSFTLRVNGGSPQPLVDDPISAAGPQAVRSLSGWIEKIKPGTQTMDVVYGTTSPVYGAAVDITVKSREQLSDISSLLQNGLSGFTALMGVLITAVGYFKKVL